MNYTGQEILDYAAKYNKKDLQIFDDLFTMLSTNNNFLKGGHDGSKALENIFYLNDKRKFLELCANLAAASGESLSEAKIFNFAIYMLFNMNLINKLCEFLNNKIIEDHSISAIGPKYAVAFVWLENNCLNSSFVLWGKDKVNAMHDRVRFLLTFFDYKNFSYNWLGFNTISGLPFHMKAMAAATTRVKTIITRWNANMTNELTNLIQILYS